ncbi:acetyltransferase [Seonamhaeicola sp.]|uniref:acetyltransferase n=1 Tax=Seonamhaeicola sp. TaxID=1912245 RepID=UPI002603D2DE|nr:acetyltransferase [Seonamhaeicola sp.]
MEKLLIIGTGDYADMASYYLSEKYRIIGFAEEAAYRTLEEFKGLPIMNFEDIHSLYSPNDIKVLVAVGPNKVNSVRERLFLEIKEMKYECITHIHPKAYVWDEQAIGENSFIFPNVTVEPYATVGKNCVLWSGAILSHHSKLMDHSFMAPGSTVSGRTTIKNNCFLGINSTIRDNLVIESHCIIGGGAIIKKNTVPNGVYSDIGTALYNTNSKNTKV